MKNTADYMDALRVKLDVDSDFKAMNFLGVKHRQQVSQWRQLHGTFSETLSLKIADALNIPQAEVLLDMQIQRENNDAVKSVWKSIAQRMYVAAATVLAFVALPYFGVTFDNVTFVMAGFIAPPSGSMYNMTYKPRYTFAIISRWRGFYNEAIQNDVACG